MKKKSETPIIVRAEDLDLAYACLDAPAQRIMVDFSSHDLAQILRALLFARIRESSINNQTKALIIGLSICSYGDVIDELNRLQNAALEAVEFGK